MYYVLKIINKLIKAIILVYYLENDSYEVCDITLCNVDYNNSNYYIKGIHQSVSDS